MLLLNGGDCLTSVRCQQCSAQELGRGRQLARLKWAGQCSVRLSPACRPRLLCWRLPCQTACQTACQQSSRHERDGQGAATHSMWSGARGWVALHPNKPVLLGTLELTACLQSSIQGLVSQLAVGLKRSSPVALVTCQ